MSKRAIIHDFLFNVFNPFISIRAMKKHTSLM